MVQVACDIKVPWITCGQYRRVWRRWCPMLLQHSRGHQSQSELHHTLFNEQSQQLATIVYRHMARPGVDPGHLQPHRYWTCKLLWSVPVSCIHDPPCYAPEEVNIKGSCMLLTGAPRWRLTYAQLLPYNTLLPLPWHHYHGITTIVWSLLSPRHCYHCFTLTVFL